MKLSTELINRLCATPKRTLNLDWYLTMSVRSILAGEPVCRVARRRCMVLVASLCIVGTTPAFGIDSKDYLRLYAHSRIIDAKEYACFDKLITAESGWRVEAANGSHWGLGQMRNAKYRNLDGYRMIDWSLRYIEHRYKGKICKGAYAHWQKHGWH